MDVMLCFVRYSWCRAEYVLVLLDNRSERFIFTLREVISGFCVTEGDAAFIHWVSCAIIENSTCTHPTLLITPGVPHFSEFLWEFR